MQGLTLIAHYLISLYAMVVLLRFLAQWLGADFRNPISQVIVQATNPPLLPLRRVIPGWKGKDMASIALLLAIIAVEAGTFSLLFGSQHSTALVPIILFRAFIITINTYFYVLILTAIFSWINQDPYHPVPRFFGAITAPLLQPLRKYIKPLGGMLDITPMLALIVIYFLQIQCPLWFQQAMFAINQDYALDNGLRALIGLMSR